MKLFQSPQERDLELLSAYLDDELSASERAKLERRLATDTGLRRTLAGIRRVQTVLTDLPRVKPPRSFTLKPNMVGQVRRAPSRLIPILNYATTLAALVFAVVIGSELTTNLRPLAAPAPAQTFEVANSAPAAEMAPTDSTALKLATETTPAEESSPFAAQSAPCDDSQEPLAGGGCGGAGGGGAPTVGGGLSDTLPPLEFSVAAATNTPTVDKSLTVTPDGTLLRIAPTETTATPEAPITVATDFYAPPPEVQTLTPTRLVLYSVGGLLLLLLIISLIVRRQ